MGVFSDSAGRRTRRPWSLRRPLAVRAKDSIRSTLFVIRSDREMSAESVRSSPKSTVSGSPTFSANFLRI